jgi:hypothetical protein
MEVQESDKTSAVQVVIRCILNGSAKRRERKNPRFPPGPTADETDVALIARFR